MRIFDFRCAGCGHVFEAFVRAEDEARTCPACGSPNASRQPVTQIALGGARRGRTIDLSSKSCPCGGGRADRRY